MKTITSLKFNRQHIYVSIYDPLSHLLMWPTKTFTSAKHSARKYSKVSNCGSSTSLNVSRYHIYISYCGCENSYVSVWGTLKHINLSIWFMQTITSLNVARQHNYILKCGAQKHSHLLIRPAFTNLWTLLHFAIRLVKGYSS